MRSQDEIRNTVVSLGLPEHPYFMRRTARAMDLLDTGKVNFVGDEIFRVHSQFDDKIYHVELNHGLPPRCDCADYQKNPGVSCKHIISSLLYARKQAITIVKTTDGNESDFWRRSWLIAQGNKRTVVYEEHDGRLFCNCGAYYQDCEHKQLVIRTVTKELKQKRITNECGTDQAKAIQEKLNGQIDSQNDNGNGATGGFVTADNHQQAPSQQLDLSDPFQESEQLDIDQIEGRANGELVHKLSNGQWVISYRGIMTLSEKHHITFDEAIHDEHTVIAKGRCGTSERVSGKPMNGCADTALALAQRNCARQLLPYAEIKALEHKAKLESEFSWQKAYEKCAKLVADLPSTRKAGGKAQVDIIINDLVNWGKLRQDNPSHYDRTEWLIIHDYCQKEARIERDPKSTNNWSYNSAVFIDRCKEAIAKVRDEKKVEANEQPLEGGNGKRKLQMDKKLRTWLIESDGTKKEISCREICEKFESEKNPRIVTRLRAGIDSGADISTVELDD